MSGKDFSARIDFKKNLLFVCLQGKGLKCRIFE